MKVEFLLINNTITEVNINNIQPEDIKNEVLSIVVPSLINTIQIYKLKLSIKFNSDSEIYSHIKEFYIKIENGPQELICLNINKKNMLISLDIPSSIKVIRSEAFKHINFKTITFGKESCAIIENSAFANCCFYEKVNYPETNLFLGDYAFSAANFKKGLHISEQCKLSQIGFKSFYGANIKSKYLNLPKTIKTIGRGAFSNVSGVSHFTIPPGAIIESIDADAFTCSDFSSITINSINDIKFGQGCFNTCISLKTFDIKNTKTTILPRKCFDDCLLLDNVFLPNTLTDIKEYCFRSCSLENIVMPIYITDVKNNSFDFVSTKNRLKINALYPFLTFN